MFVKIWTALMMVVLLGACASTKLVETRTDGGTIKFRKRGLAKEQREDNAVKEADEHCKRNGFKTYQVESEVQDGRYIVMRFKCTN